MSTYPVGTIAIATVRGVENVRVMLDSEGDWHTAETDPYGDWFHDSDHVTDVRPLAVLDVESLSDDLRSLSESLRRVEDASHGNAACADPNDRNRLMDLVKAIEAQTKPPRIDEPGPWGVVRDHRGQEYVRESAVASFPWNPIGKKLNVTWAQIIDPTLIREGLS